MNKSFLESENITFSQLRTLKNLKQVDVRKKLGLSDRGFRQKENCETEFSFTEFRELAKIYGLSLDDLAIVFDNTKKFNKLKNKNDD
jgi:transcriptional regulator with XRE-family HTH domain